MLFFQGSRCYREYGVAWINHNASLKIYSAIGSFVDSSPNLGGSLLESIPTRLE